MTKEEIEQASFENFCRIGDLRFDSYHSQPPPEPDIGATFGDMAVGVEITHFHREAQKARESEEDKALSLAEQMYAKQNLPCLDVCVHWAPHTYFGRRDRR